MKRRSIADNKHNRDLLSELDIEYGFSALRLKLYFYITNADFTALKELIAQK